MIGMVTHAESLRPNSLVTPVHKTSAGSHCMEVRTAWSTGWWRGALLVAIVSLDDGLIMKRAGILVKGFVPPASRPPPAGRRRRRKGSAAGARRAQSGSCHPHRGRADAVSGLCSLLVRNAGSDRAWGIGLMSLKEDSQGRAPQATENDPSSPMSMPELGRPTPSD